MPILYNLGAALVSLALILTMKGTIQEETENFWWRYSKPFLFVLQLLLWIFCVRESFRLLKTVRSIIDEHLESV
jgi:cytochrome bd-type quinol oxidase subunit 2